LSEDVPENPMLSREDGTIRMGRAWSGVPVVLQVCPRAIDFHAIDVPFGVRSLGDTARGEFNALILMKEYEQQ
jgi:hypothetical protein